MKKIKTMSKTKHSGSAFSNEFTLRRRAWIEKALEGVRGRNETTEDGQRFEDQSSKPHLYVVKTDDVR